MLLSERKILAADLGKAGHFSGMAVIQALKALFPKIPTRTIKLIIMAGTIELISWESGSQVDLRLLVHHRDKEVQVKLEASFGSPLPIYLG